MTITEKIDGTNALVEVRKVEPGFESIPPGATRIEVTDYSVENPTTNHFQIRAGSRTRWLLPNSVQKNGDNFGFAEWVRLNALDLVRLGEGKHYGEWWGAGIGRRYDLDYKVFSLFNTFRPAESLPSCVRQVPVLYKGPVDFAEVGEAEVKLFHGGSVAAPGFMKPEGLIVWMGGERYKHVFESSGPKTREENAA
jgi:hypothetical protein